MKVIIFQLLTLTILCSSVSVSFCKGKTDLANRSKNCSLNINEPIKSNNFLYKALSSTLKNNNEILAAQKELLAVHESHVAASAAVYRPTVSATYQFQDKNSSSKYLTGQMANNKRVSKGPTNSCSVNVKQNIYRCGADIAKLAETDMNIRAKQSSYEATVQNVIKNVITLYYSILAKREEISNLKSLLESRNESVQVATKMYETGATKLLGVSQAQASRAETESKLAKADADLESLYAQFNELTGCKVEVVLNDVGYLFDNKNLTIKEAQNIASKMNPNIIAATSAKLAAQKATKTVNTEFMPSLDATGSADYSKDSADRAINSKSKGFTFGLALTIPIYDGGISRSEKRKLAEVAAKTMHDLERTKNEVDRDIVSVIAAIRSALKNIASAKIAIDARNKALKDTKDEYDAGLKVMDDVLKAQSELHEAKFVLTQAKQELYINQCKLSFLTGCLSPKKLNIQESGFDYNKHFGQTVKRF